MSDFIATIAPKKRSNWDICRRHNLWGVVAAGNNWRKNVGEMTGGDRIFVWQGGSPNGFIAQLRSLAVAEMVGPFTTVPWPDPESFGAVFPIEVIKEVDPPLSDRFPASGGQIATRYRFSNSVLQHGFEEISSEIADRIATDFE